jgi:hypothetical protein
MSFLRPRSFAPFLLAAALGLPTVAAHAAPTYSELYFLGGSQFDAGNWLLDDDIAAAHPAFAPTADKGYNAGRFQEGPAVSDYLATLLGHDSVPSLAGGQNYAWGTAYTGPTAGFNPAPPALSARTELHFPTQIDALLADTGGVLADDALFAISMGGNDVNLFGRPASEAATRGGILANQVQRMYDAGARTFLIFQLGAGTGEYGSIFNDTVEAELALLPGLRVTLFDPATYFDTLNLQALLDLGFTTVSPGTCLANPACKAGAIAAAEAGVPYLDSNHFTFDGVHINTKLQRGMADFLLARLPEPPTEVPAPGSGGMLLAMMGVVAMLRLRGQRRRA